MKLDETHVLIWPATSEPPFDRPGGRQLIYLLLIAAVIGLAAYPVVRNLTRRLERLRPLCWDGAHMNCGQFRWLRSSARLSRLRACC